MWSPLRSSRPWSAVLRVVASFKWLVISCDLSLLTTHFSHRPPLDAPLVQFSLEDAFHVDAGRVDHVRIEFSDVDQVFDLGNRDFCRGRHHGIKVARRLPIYQIPPLIALPRL